MATEIKREETNIYTTWMHIHCCVISHKLMVNGCLWLTTAQIFQAFHTAPLLSIQLWPRPDCPSTFIIDYMDLKL